MSLVIAAIVVVFGGGYMSAQAQNWTRPSYGPPQNNDTSPVGTESYVSLSPLTLQSVAGQLNFGSAVGITSKSSLGVNGGAPTLNIAAVGSDTASYSAQVPVSSNLGVFAYGQDIGLYAYGKIGVKGVKSTGGWAGLFDGPVQISVASSGAPADLTLDGILTVQNGLVSTNPTLVSTYPSYFHASQWLTVTSTGATGGSTGLSVGMTSGSGAALDITAADALGGYVETIGGTAALAANSNSATSGYGLSLYVPIPDTGVTGSIIQGISSGSSQSEPTGYAVGIFGQSDDGLDGTEQAAGIRACGPNSTANASRGILGKSTSGSWGGYFDGSVLLYTAATDGLQIGSTKIIGEEWRTLRDKP